MIRSSLFKAGIVLGTGLGGFIDGIVLHQILGWHHLICMTGTCRPDSVAALEVQNMQDGFFHLATLLLTIAGLVWAWRAHRDASARGSGPVLCGGAVAGWGVFNFVEGLIDHQILSLHHVKPDSPNWFAYDLLFLASGLVLVALGTWIARPKGRTA